MAVFILYVCNANEQQPFEAVVFVIEKSCEWYLKLLFLKNILFKVDVLYYINHSVSPSVCQSIKQSISYWINPSLSKSANKKASHAVSQPVTQAVSQSVCQPSISAQLLGSC